MSTSASHTLVGRHPVQGCGGVVHQRTFSLWMQACAGSLTAAGLLKVRPKEPGIKKIWRGNTTTAEAPVRAAPAVVLLLLTGYVVVQRDAVPAVVHVADLVAPAALGNLVPQGDGRQVLEKDLLGLVHGLVAVGDRRGVQAVGDGLVERRVGVAS